jgi:hypothetical protein
MKQDGIISRHRALLSVGSIAMLVAGPAQSAVTIDDGGACTSWT